jgi:hypothetical protein
LKRLLPILLLLVASAFGQNTYQPVFVGQNEPLESQQLTGRRALWLDTSDSSLKYCTEATVAMVCTNWQAIGSSGLVSPVTGPLDILGDVSWTGTATGSLTGNVTGNLTGNADTATLAASSTKDAILDKSFINVVTDCAAPTGTTDAYAALRACRALYPGRHFLLPKIQAFNVSTCDYTVSDSIVKTTDTNATSEVWEGGGGSSGQAENFPSAVRLCSPVNVTPFEIPASYGAGFTIRNLHLYGNACWTPTSAATFVMPFGWGGTSTADGIRAYARVKIENVTVECFGRHGINLDTDAHSPGNTNSTSVKTVLLANNRGTGLFIRGQDSQASSFSGVSSTSNQLDGIADLSFLGNTHSAHHTSSNGIDQSADGPAIAITGSVVASNYATMTAVAHGLSRGDMVRQASTSGSLLNGRFFVLDVPTANTYIIYTPQQDRAVTVEVASAFKLSGAVTWSKGIDGLCNH